jgi:hypothetical protein
MSILLNPVFPSLPIPKPIAKKPVAKEKKKEREDITSTLVKRIEQGNVRVIVIYMY